MRLAEDIAEGIAVAARAWAESTTSLPLVIRKNDGGAICALALPKERYTKRELAAELGVHRNTLARYEERFGLTPDSGGKYSRETVEDLKRWLRNEEGRRRR